jgi:hypothetical protein
MTNERPDAQRASWLPHRAVHGGWLDASMVLEDSASDGHAARLLSRLAARGSPALLASSPPLGARMAVSSFVGGRPA